jgi:hypothetical protein
MITDFFLGALKKNGAWAFSGRYLELPKSPNFTEITLDITEIPIRSSEIPFRRKDITLF